MITTLIAMTIGGIILAVIGAAALIFTIIHGHNSGWWDNEHIWCAITGTLMAFGIITGGVSGANWVDCASTYENCVAAEIVSIERDNLTSGSFRLGFGTINTDTYYFFYEKTGDKQYKLDKVKASCAYIIEDNTSSRLKSVWEIKEYDTYKPYYNIYVPEGTIQVSFSL